MGKWGRVSGLATKLGKFDPALSDIQLYSRLVASWSESLVHPATSPHNLRVDFRPIQHSSAWRIQTEGLYIINADLDRWFFPVTTRFATRNL